MNNISDKKETKIILFIFLFVLFLVIVKKIHISEYNNDVIVGDKESNVLGDVDGSGAVNTRDYIMVRKHLLGLSSLNDSQKKRADVDGSKNVNTKDYIIIIKAILYKTAIEPPKEEQTVINVNSVTLNKTSLTLEVGKSEILQATVSPSNATNKNVTWTSSNESVVTVSNGVLTAKKAGTTVITIESTNGKKATCTVTVKEKTYDVTFIGSSIIETNIPQSITLKGSETIPIIQSKKLYLFNKKQYVVSFDYSTTAGTNKFDVDFYPDSLPQIYPIAKTSAQHYDWIVSSEDINMGNCQLRIFDDVQEAKENDIIINNIIFGTVEKITRNNGSKIGTMPSPVRRGYRFLGWYTSPTVGNKVSENTIVNATMKLYPHWEKTNPKYKTDDFPYLYEDETARLSIEKQVYNSPITNRPTIYYVAHLILDDYTRLYTGVANTSHKDSSGKYAGGRVSDAAAAAGAIFAFEGDYAVNGRGSCKLKGVIRNGYFLSLKPIDLSTLPTSSVGYGYYSKKTGILGYNKSLKGANLQEAVSKGDATDSICFQPNLLVNGVNQYTKDEDKTNRPRQATFIGYVRPGEFYIIVSEGLAYSDSDKPSDGISYGLTRYEKAEILKTLGCTYGAQLDGGGSIIVWFMGKQLQSRKVISTERDWLLDFVYFK